MTKLVRYLDQNLMVKIAHLIYLRVLEEGCIKNLRKEAKVVALSGYNLTNYY